jgi:hypothetical protein
MFVIFPFVDEEINEHYPFAIGLNGMKGLAHLTNLAYNWPNIRGVGLKRHVNY